MTITVELPPEIEQRVLAQARVRSLSVDAIVQDSSLVPPSLHSQST